MMIILKRNRDSDEGYVKNWHVKIHYLLFQSQFLKLKFTLSNWKHKCLLRNKKVFREIQW